MYFPFLRAKQFDLIALREAFEFLVVAKAREFAGLGTGVSGLDSRSGAVNRYALAGIGQGLYSLLDCSGSGRGLACQNEGQVVGGDVGQKLADVKAISGFPVVNGLPVNPDFVGQSGIRGNLAGFAKSIQN